VKIEPCLALLAARVPAGDDWAYEVKWDGYRLAVHVEPGQVRVITRGGHDWTTRFPTIVHDARELRLDSASLTARRLFWTSAGHPPSAPCRRRLAAEAGSDPLPGTALRL
jgi:bifunctional non-homologous end joining protein LigD